MRPKWKVDYVGNESPAEQKVTQAPALSQAPAILNSIILYYFTVHYFRHSKRAVITIAAIAITATAPWPLKWAPRLLILKLSLLSGIMLFPHKTRIFRDTKGVIAPFVANPSSRAPLPSL
jgi:hypothetical protein